MGESAEKFRMKENVVFSSDGKRLLRWPMYKETEEYTIPDGVEEIEEKAFKGAVYLKRLRMPELLEKCNREGKTRFIPVLLSAREKGENGKTKFNL